jgi:hypothetical protein
VAVQFPLDQGLCPDEFLKRIFKLSLFFLSLFICFSPVFLLFFSLTTDLPQCSIEHMTEWSVIIKVECCKSPSLSLRTFCPTYMTDRAVMYVGSWMDARLAEPFVSSVNYV